MPRQRTPPSAPPRPSSRPPETVAAQAVAQTVLEELVEAGKSVSQVNCPTLEATVGASERCIVVAPAGTFGATVVVTRVRGTEVDFSIQVDHQPL